MGHLYLPPGLRGAGGAIVQCPQGGEGTEFRGGGGQSGRGGGDGGDSPGEKEAAVGQRRPERGRDGAGGTGVPRTLSQEDRELTGAGVPRWVGT